MAEIVNLRLARKRKARADAESAAAGNRAAHGRSKAEKRSDATERAARDKHLDGHKREAPDEK